MTTFFMNVPVPVDQIMEVYRLLGTPQPPRPPVPAYDPFGVAPPPPPRRPHYHVWTWNLDGNGEICTECGLTREVEPEEVEEPEPTKPVIIRRKPRAKPRCKEVKIFGNKKVRCLKHPNHDGRHSWMDAAS